MTILILWVNGLEITVWGVLITKSSMLIIRCRWKLNSFIGADFYAYAQIHIAPETLKMEGVLCDLGFDVGTHFWRTFEMWWSIYSLSTAQYLLDLGFPRLRLETVRSQRVFQDHLYPSPFILPLTIMTCPRKVTMEEWFSEAELDTKLLCVILSLGFFLPSLALLLYFAQRPPSHGNRIILYFGLINLLHPTLFPLVQSHM